MAAQSRQIIKDNNLEDIITVIQAKVEDVKELPDGCEKVGCLLFSSTMYSIVYRLGRRNHIRVDGILPLLRVYAEHRHLRS